MATDFWLQYRSTLTIATLDFEQLVGEGRFAPRLVFNFESRAFKPYREAEVLQLRSDVRFGNQLVGTATLREVVHVYEDSGAQLILDAPISREALAYVDEQARTADVQLELSFRGYARATQSPSGTPADAIAWEYFDLHSGQGNVRMPKSDWITRVLEPLGPPSHVLLDLPLPEPPDRARWQKSLDHIAEADRLFHDGRDAEVLARCHAALEAIEGAPLVIFDGVADPEKRKQLNAALAGFKAFLNSGRQRQG
jgi:hypothetical protein